MEVEKPLFYYLLIGSCWKKKKERLAFGTAAPMNFFFLKERLAHVNLNRERL